MAQKIFWAWLNMQPDGGEIPGESGSGQQYFAAKEKAPITRPATAESIVAEPRRSRFWSACYFAVDLSVCVVMLPLLIVRAAIEEIDWYACRLLRWLDRKRG